MSLLLKKPTQRNRWLLDPTFLSISVVVLLLVLAVDGAPHDLAARSRELDVEAQVIELALAARG